MLNLKNFEKLPQKTKSIRKPSDTSLARKLNLPSLSKDQAQNDNQWSQVQSGSTLPSLTTNIHKINSMKQIKLKGKNAVQNPLSEKKNQQQEVNSECWSSPVNIETLSQINSARDIKQSIFTLTSVASRSPLSFYSTRNSGISIQNLVGKYALRFPKSELTRERNKSFQEQQSSQLQTSRLSREDELKIVSEIYEEDKNYINQNQEERSEKINKAQNYQINQKNLDEKLKSLEGPISFEKYIKCYHHFDKVQDFTQFYEMKTNKHIKLAKTVIDQLIIPKKIQAIQNEAVEYKTELNLAGQLLLNGYYELFLNSLGTAPNDRLVKIDLRRNELDQKKTQKIVSSLPLTLTWIDLSYNKIGPEGVNSLTRFIKNKESILRVLNLENNQLQDNLASKLLQVLYDNQFLNVLNLSKNSITENSMFFLARFLRKSSEIQEIYLHYNMIGSQGGTVLFKGILKNEYLKVLDLSFNSLGNHLPSDNKCAHAIFDVLQKPHPNLQHLDLSFNNLTFSDSRIIQQSLQFNRVLYGFHYVGNASEFVVNPRGSLFNEIEFNNYIKQRIQELTDIQKEYDFTDACNQKTSQIKINHIQNLPASNYVRINSCLPSPSYNQKDCCWICQNWQEVQFTYRPGYSGKLNIEPLFLHLDFEDWRPSIMEFKEGKFYLSRMCPPDVQIKFFFSNPVLGQQAIARDYKIFNIESTDLIYTSGVPILYADETFTISDRMDQVNYIEIKAQNLVVNPNKNYICNTNIKPREPEKIWDINPGRAEKRNWTIENSIFNNFPPDSTKNIQKCIDFDIDIGKLVNYIQKQKEVIQLKQVLNRYYIYLVSAFNYYASKTLDYSIPSVNYEVLRDFISQIGLFNKKILRPIDLDIHFISSVCLQIRENKYEFVKQNALIRYQFIEIFIRIAKDYQLKHEYIYNVPESLEALFEKENIFQAIKRFGNPQDWRDKRYWTQIMDITIKYKMPIIKLLFDYTSQVSEKKQFKNFIIQKEFVQLFIDSNLCPQKLREKEIYLIFLQSMITQVNQVANNKHLHMNLYEFLEALARVAERLSPSSPCNLDKNLNYRQRAALPLFIKFEGLLFIMYMRLKNLFIETFGSNHKNFQFQSKIIRRSVLETNDAKRYGFSEQINQEEFDSPSQLIQVEDLDKLCITKDHIKNTESTIKLLIDSESPKQLETPTLITESSSELTPNILEKFEQNRNRIINAGNLLKSVTQFEVLNKIIERKEIQESSPYSRMQIQQRQSRRTQFKLSKFAIEHKNYDEEQEY